jgi:hypothetical protein
MNRIPFSIYDFFGYLAAGFVLILSVDYAFQGGWLLRDNLGTVLSLFWLLAAYVAGHLIAGISSALLEQGLVRSILGSPEETLFHDRSNSRWRHVFPAFFRPLPKETRHRVLQKAARLAAIEEPGRGLFFHCHPIVKRDQPTLERLNTFLNQYGFCRNLSVASFLAAIVLLVGVLWSWHIGQDNNAMRLYWAGIATVVGVGMLYRYLKFFRHYTLEVFMTYAELDLRT